jgi:hypothetical protein
MSYSPNLPALCHSEVTEPAPYADLVGNQNITADD